MLCDTDPGALLRGAGAGGLLEQRLRQAAEPAHVSGAKAWGVMPSWGHREDTEPAGT